jgi:hypothetical protein
MNHVQACSSCTAFVPLHVFLFSHPKKTQSRLDAVNNPISVSMALLACILCLTWRRRDNSGRSDTGDLSLCARSGGSSSTCACCWCSSVTCWSNSLVWISLTNTSLSWNSDIVGVDFSGEVSQGSGVVACPGVVGTRSKLLNTLVSICIVLDNAFANERNVEESVEKIWSPVICWSSACNGEATSADCDVWKTDLV